MERTHRVAEIFYHSQYITALPTPIAGFYRGKGREGREAGEKEELID